jgi:hypothetical protein
MKLFSKIVNVQMSYNETVRLMDKYMHRRKS